MPNSNDTLLPDNSSLATYQGLYQKPLEDNNDSDHESHGLIYYLMEWWPIFKKMSSMSLQMAASFSFSIEMIIMAAILINLDDSEEHVAATGLSITLTNTIAMLSLCPLFAVSLATSRAVGAIQGEEDQAHRELVTASYRNGLIMGIPLALPMIFTMYFSKNILTALKQDSEVSEMAQDILRIFLLTAGPLVFRLIADQIMFANKKNSAAMIISLATFALCTTGGVIATFAFDGGKNAIVIAYTIEAFLTAFLFNLYIALHPDMKRFHFFNFLRPLSPDFGQLKSMIYLGSSNFFSITIETGTTFFTTILAGIISNQSQAALTSGMQGTLVVELLQMGFGQTILQEMSRLIGAKEFQKANHTGKYGLITTMIYVIAINAIFSTQPKLLLEILGENHEETYDILKILLPIIGIKSTLDALRYNLLQQLRGLDDVVGSSVVSSGSFLLGLGTGAALGIYSPLGINGLVAGRAIGSLLGAGALAYRWKNRINVETISANESQKLQAQLVSQNRNNFFMSSPLISSDDNDSLAIRINTQTF